MNEPPLPRSVRFGLPAGLFLVTFLCFAPALGGEFVNWDDTGNFIDNDNYRGLSPAHLGWMFTTFLGGHYQPLSWVTLGLDYTIWRMNPAGYRLTNYLLHSANAVLFYLLILALLRLWRPAADRAEEIRLRLAAAAGALLFSIHPLRVESVAWITERRDVLSGLFFLVTLLAYLRMVREGARGDRLKWLLISVGCFALSVLSKAWGMTLPAVLLALDVFPLRRLRAPHRTAVLVEKLPFVLIAGVTAFLAARAQAFAGAALKIEDHTLVERLLQSAYGLCFYVWKTVLPINLSPLYLIDTKLRVTDPRFAVPFAIVIFAAVTVIALRRRWPALAVAAFCYVATVSPVLGIAQSGPQLAADRYTYLSCLPWAVLLAVVLCRSIRPRAAGIGAAAALAVIGTLTFRQAFVWRDSLSLWEHAVAVGPRNYVAWRHLGQAREKRGDYREALAAFSEALRITPKYGNAARERALVKQRLGDHAGAIADFDYAIAHGEDPLIVYFNRGVARRATGDIAGAIADFTEAIRLRPELGEPYSNRGQARFELKQFDLAKADFDEAIRLAPRYPPAYAGRSRAKYALGDLAGAVADLESALALLPAESPLRPAMQRSLAEAREKLNPQR